MVEFRTNRKTKNQFPVNPSEVATEKYRDIEEPHVEIKTPSGYTTLHIEVVFPDGAREKMTQEQLDETLRLVAETVENSHLYLLQPPDSDSKAWVRTEIGEDTIEDIRYETSSGIPPKNLHILLILTDNPKDVGAGNTGAHGERGSFKVFAGVPGFESQSFDLVGNFTTVGHETGHTLGASAKGRYEFNQFGALTATRTLLNNRKYDTPGFRQFFSTQVTRAISPTFRKKTQNQAKRFVRHFYRTYPLEVRELLASSESDYDSKLLEEFLRQEEVET